MYLAGEGISLHFSTYNWLTDMHKGVLFRKRKLCLWWVYCFYVVCQSVPLSEMFCFLNILKIHCWNFINFANMLIFTRQKSKV